MNTSIFPGSLRIQPAVGAARGPPPTATDLKPTRIVHLLALPLSHLHEFELADGRRIGLPDNEWDDEPCLDDTTLLVAETVGVAGTEFSYVFDLGDYWLHRCSVQHTNADPSDAYGPLPGPPLPVPIWGWGNIPDQYGRRFDGDTGQEHETDDGDAVDLTDPAILTETARMVAEPLTAWLDESGTTLPARLIAFNEVMADPDQLWLAVTHALPHSDTFTTFMHNAEPVERDTVHDLIGVRRGSTRNPEFRTSSTRADGPAGIDDQDVR